MDKNKFWLGGRLFNTTSPRLVAPTQHKARLQVGPPTHVRNANARNICTSVSWAPQRNARHVRKMVAQTQNSSATKTSTQGSTRLKDELEVDFLIRPHQVWAPQRNARHVCKMGAQTHHKARPQVGRPNATQGTSTSWAPQHTSATQMQGTSARPQVGRHNATQGTSARWSPKRKTHPQGKRLHKGALG
jgi:hypothetical protein